jgi:hypothetical protein
LIACSRNRNWPSAFFLLLLFGVAGCGSIATQTSPPGNADPPPAQTSGPNVASDNFDRADGDLGAHWSVLSDFGGTDGGIQLINHSFAPTNTVQMGFPTTIGTWTGSTSAFGPNQFATVQISAIAPEQSVVSISAATPAGSNTIYTYALTSGQPLQTPQPINITGLADAVNNGNFVISSLGQGTFTAPNAHGVAASDQTGIGISATDSLGGPVVRSTTGVLNGYYTYIGNNSGYVARNNGATDGRLYVLELWKFVNGTAKEIQQLLTATTIPDSPGDTYHLFALGNKVALYKNGVVVAAEADSSLTSGSPGIIASSATGAGHTMPLGSNVGVSGMQFTNWSASDAPSTPSGWTAQATETILVKGLAPSPPWSQIPGLTKIPTFASTAETQFGGNSSLVYTGRIWANDQSSSVVVSTVKGYTSVSLLVRASTSEETFYLGEFHFTDGPGAGFFYLEKFVDGVSTELTTMPGTVNFADVLRLEVSGTTLTFKQNGNTVLTATDSDITSGSPGVTGGGNAYIMFWEGDEPSQ